MPAGGFQMLAHKKILTPLAQRCNDPYTCALPTHSQVESGTKLPDLPAMAKSAVLLQMLLAANVVDLQAITAVIRDDVGLTTQLLRLALRASPQFPRKPLKVEELIVHLGLQTLRAMAAETKLLGCQPGDDFDLKACSAFWAQARRTAHTAEQVAAEISPADREFAYLAGLLRRLGSIPALLGWRIPAFDLASPAEIGWRMAKSWNFPQVLVEVIRGDEPACRSRQSRWLLRLVNSAQPAVWCD
jgi:HD-like signal output (HDOD) protein